MQLHASPATLTLILGSTLAHAAITPGEWSQIQSAAGPLFSEAAPLLSKFVPQQPASASATPTTLQTATPPTAAPGTPSAPIEHNPNPFMQLVMSRLPETIRGPVGSLLDGALSADALQPLLASLEHGGLGLVEQILGKKLPLDKIEDVVSALSQLLNVLKPFLDGDDGAAPAASSSTTPPLPGLPRPTGNSKWARAYKPVKPIKVVKGSDI